jgi:hypothetical protein
VSVKRALVVLTGIAGLALVLSAIGAVALGPEILGPAWGAIENMPGDARETSGIDAVLDGVEDTLSEWLPGDIAIPEEVPEELPEDAEIPVEIPEDAEIPEELPEELPEDADVGLEEVDSALDLVPVETSL